ncbi:hypothetical protein Esti_005215 [Eimeria stiedai]
MESPSFALGSRGLLSKQTGGMLASAYGGGRLVNGSGGQQGLDASEENPTAALLRLTLLQLQRVLTQNAALSDALRGALAGEERTCASLQQHKVILEEAAAQNAAATDRARSLIAAEVQAAHTSAQEARDTMNAEVKRIQQEAEEARSLMAAELENTKKTEEELRRVMTAKIQQAEQAVEEARRVLTLEREAAKKSADEARVLMESEIEKMKKIAADTKDEAAEERSALQEREKSLLHELQEKEKQLKELTMHVDRQQAAHREELERLTSAVASLQRELADREAASAQRDSELQAARQQMEGGVLRIKELEGVTRMLEEEAARKDKFLESELAEKDLTFQQRLQQQEEQMQAALSRRDAELAEAMAQHQEALDAMEKRHQTACELLAADLRKDAARALQIMEEQLQKQTSMARERLAQVTELQGECKVKEAALLAAKKEAEEERASKEEQTKAAQAALAALHDGMMLKEQELQQLHQQQHAELQKQLDAKDRNVVEVLMRRDEEQKQHRKENELLQKKLQEALKELAAVRAQQAAAAKAAEQQHAELERLHGLRKQMEKKLLQMQIEGRRAVRPRLAAVAVVMDPETSAPVEADEKEQQQQQSEAHTPRQPGKQRRKESQMQVEWADQAGQGIPVEAVKKQADASSAGREPNDSDACSPKAAGQGWRGRRARTSVTGSVSVCTPQEASAPQPPHTEHSQAEGASQGSSKAEECSPLGEDLMQTDEPHDARRHSLRLRKHIKIEASPAPLPSSAATSKPTTSHEDENDGGSNRFEAVKEARGQASSRVPSREELRRMGKKRGGRRHRGGKKASEETAVAEDGVDQAEVGGLSTSRESLEARSPEEEGSNSSSRGGRGAQGRAAVSEYFAHIKKLIEDCPFQGTVQFEAFITSTVQEILNRGLLVVSDQKCSRVVEKLIALLANFIAFQEGGRKPTFDTGESSEEEKLQSRLRCLDSYVSLLRAIAPVAPNLATHPNGSHVLQTLLNSVPAVVEFEKKHKNTTGEGGCIFCFKQQQLLSEGGGWLQLLHCAMGSHIFRSAVRAAAGIDCLVPADVAGRRSRRKTRRDCEETLTSPQVSAALTAVLGKAGQDARLAKVPKAFLHELAAITNAVAAAIAADPFSLPFDAFAAPSLQVLMLTLHARKQGGAPARQDIAVSNKIGFSAFACGHADALVDSPTGSRILEVALPLLTAERFQLVFAHWMVKKLNDLAQGRFGNFVLQKVLQAPVFQGAHLKQFVQTLDFGGCLNAATSAVLWRCAEACRRLQVSYKEFAKKMFEAVGVKGGSATRYAWWCLLTLCLPDDLPSELMAESGAGEEGDKAAKTLEHTQEEGEEGKEHDTWSLIRMQDVCTPSGCSIIISLLTFPPATIQPLNAGFKKFIKDCRRCKIAVKKWKGKGVKPGIEFHPLLELMTTNKLASRVLQQIVDPATAGIQQSAVQYMIRSLVPFIPSFAVDPVGGFVLTSIYSAASPEVKRQIAEALLQIEAELKTKNYAAYMKCEIYRYTKDKEEWQARQEKRNRTRNLFKDILATPAVEAEDEGENEENGLLKTLKDDPIAKQLTQDVGVSEKKDGVKKKKRRKDDGEEAELEIDSTLDVEAAQNIDRVFLEAFDEKQQQLSRKKWSKNTLKASGEDVSSEPTTLDPPLEFESGKCKKDPTLEAALFFIEGTRESLSKRERARRRKLEASFLEDKSLKIIAEKLAAAESHRASEKKQKISSSRKRKKFSL